MNNPEPTTSDKIRELLTSSLYGMVWVLQLLVVLPVTIIVLLVVELADRATSYKSK